ncbi:uncharacterized protein LOC122859540 [Aphidius gifuensis]|uniref:uncharacterized protein LOC122859540 n=1 Tax=Aphidius gifuensis TaxID=684658 RepID=UPI001CDC9153|nr:uncharacterized protein LOC122859540 [Aphidius gifuensis]
MIHDPCGPLNITSPCMQNGKCSKGFPKLFTIETQSGQDGYPKYRRRSPEDGGQTFQLRKSSRIVTIDNRWIVPYSPVLLRAFDCHINIELCHSVKAIQYICSYINKGSDQAAFSVESRDEIKAYQNGRYIISSEAAWRILAPKNDTVNVINEKILSMFEADEKTYISFDTLSDQDDAVDIPIEFLNSLNPSGLPPHKLDLKIGAPIILMRNLNAPKLCNGTRLRIVSLKKNLIEAEILTGSASGQIVYIPRIPMITNEYPFEFKRVQFPIKLCFAMSINKAQGQTMKVSGIDNTDPCFTHGQFYVACSRVSSEKNLYIYASDQRTNNIVYKEILDYQ